MSVTMPIQYMCVCVSTSLLNSNHLFFVNCLIILNGFQNTADLNNKQGRLSLLVHPSYSRLQFLFSTSNSVAATII